MQGACSNVACIKIPTTKPHIYNDPIHNTPPEKNSREPQIPPTKQHMYNL